MIKRERERETGFIMTIQDKAKYSIGQMVDINGHLFIILNLSKKSTFRRIGYVAYWINQGRFVNWMAEEIIKPIPLC